MIDDVRAAYTALRTGNGRANSDNVPVLPLPASDGVYVSVDEAGRPTLLLRVGPAIEPAESGVATLNLRARALVLDGRRSEFIEVVCLFEALADVFEHFVVAVAERVGAGERGEVALGSVLAKWRQFLIAAEAPPGRDTLAALFGELLMVMDVIRAGGATSLDFWVGPFGARHDLRAGDTAVEVKTTRAHTTRRITIHGEDQLVAPEDGALFLHLVRIEDVPGGDQSVATLIDNLLVEGADPESLFAAMSAVGVPPSEITAAGEVTFGVRERLTFPVDDRMPRITPSAFVGGVRPNGVIDLRYTIDLDHCLGLALDGQGHEAVARSIARGSVP